MNKFAITLFVSCLVASSLALPISNPEDDKAAEESPSKPQTQIHMVDDNDDARRMYYERYLMDRDDSLQHSANSGRGVNVENDYSKTKRSAPEVTKEENQEQKETKPATKMADVDADAVSVKPWGDIGMHLKGLNLKKTPIAEGAGYTKRSAPEVPETDEYKKVTEEQKETKPATKMADVDADAVSVKPWGDIGMHLKGLNLKKTPIAEGAGYTKRSAPEVPETDEYKKATEEEEVTEDADPSAGHSSLGYLLKSLGIESTPVVSGAGYTRKRRAPMEEESADKDTETYSEVPVEAKEGEDASAGHANLGYLLKSLGIESTPVVRGAGYTRKRRDAMEEESAKEAPAAKETKHASADEDVLKKIAMAYMLQAGDEPKPHWAPGSSYSG